MTRLLDLVLAPAPMEPQHRDTPLVYVPRVDVAVGLRVRDHFAASGETDGGSVSLADVLLERLAIALVCAAFPVEASNLRHTKSAGELNVITAGEILLLAVQ